MKNYEPNILKNLKWTEEQQQFLGALVYDVEDCNGNELVTIVCERTEHNIKLMAIYPNENDSDPIKHILYIDTKKNVINFNQSTEHLASEEEAEQFIELVNTLILNTKPTFYPTTKIQNSLSSKNLNKI